MPAKTADLFLLEDLEDVSKTSALAHSDLAALQAVADWIKTFVAKPHKDLGRAGAVCPFVPGSLERRTLWLAAEQIADRSAPAVVELMNRYIRRLLDAQPTDGDDTKYKTIVVVFPDLPADRAQGVLDEARNASHVAQLMTTAIVFKTPVASLCSIAIAGTTSKAATSSGHCKRSSIRRARSFTA